MYFSDGDEELKSIKRNCNTDKKVGAAQFLEAALSYGLISSYEYNNEILENPETTAYKTVLSGMKIMPEIESLQLDFEFPSDDTYYNYVSDRRTVREKKSLELEFGKN